ncbi:MAG: hypothetical protein JNM94_17000 [Phycisphaerae bacterium]|nr:hypothetical protein [Phycisphaerae bacterium]
MHHGPSPNGGASNGSLPAHPATSHLNGHSHGAPAPSAPMDGALSVSAPNGAPRPTSWSAPNGHPTGHPTGHANGHGYPNGHADPRLGDLVSRAEMSIGELERLARTTLDATTAATQSAADLQERLRLGVRMLQAFDVQIDRAQQTAGHVQAQLLSQLNPQALQQIAMQVQATVHAQAQAHLMQVVQQGEMRIRSATEALERRVTEAMGFLDERLRAANEQIARLVDERLSAAERSIEAKYGPARDELRRFADEMAAGFAAKLDRVVSERTVAPSPNVHELHDAETRVRALLGEIEHRATSVEATIARADERLRQLNRQSAEAADGLLGTVGTATTLKDLIAAEAADSKRLADDAAATTRELQSELSQLVERCITTRAALGHEMQDFVEASRTAEARSAAMRAMQTELDALLTRLAPWESLVRRELSPASHVVETISSTVRQSLAEEMKGFTNALRTIASRAETAFSNAKFDEFSAFAECLAADDCFSTALDMPSAHAMAAVAMPATQSALAATNDVPRTSVTSLDTNRLSAEIMALDQTSLLRPLR